MSLPHFREFGWEPVALAVDSACVEAGIDPLLAATLPPDVQVHRVRALPPRLCRMLALGNVAYRAWFSLGNAGSRLLRESRFDLVYFSTSQHVATALGPRWLRRFKVPFVVDIQDPWVTDFYSRPGAPRPPGGWKYRFAAWQARRLEPRIWRESSGFVSVNDAYLAQLRRRYDWFARKPAAAIPFAASEADFEFARSRSDVRPAFQPDSGHIHCVGVGVVGPIMRPALVQLFDSVRRLHDADPSAAGRLRFHFIGTSYAPAALARPSVGPIAAEFGLSHLVEEQTARVSYFTALKTIGAADAVIIPGSDDTAYSPSKLANCWLARRPTLALAAADSVFEQTARQLGFTVATRPAGEDVIARFLSSVPRQGPVPPDAGEVFFRETFSAHTATQRQCALFEAALHHQS